MYAYAYGCCLVYNCHINNDSVLCLCVSSACVYNAHIFICAKVNVRATEMQHGLVWSFFLFLCLFFRYINIKGLSCDRRTAFYNCNCFFYFSSLRLLLCEIFKKQKSSETIIITMIVESFNNPICHFLISILHAVRLLLFV